MTHFEQIVKGFLEETFNQPISSRELKKLLKVIFVNLFDSLVINDFFEFPKGYGSLRIKQLKPFEILKNAQIVKITDRRIVKYFAGKEIKRRIK